MQDSPKLLENPFDMQKDELGHHFQGQHLLPLNIMTNNRCMETVTKREKYEASNTLMKCINL